MQTRYHQQKAFRLMLFTIAAISFSILLVGILFTGSLSSGIQPVQAQDSSTPVPNQLDEPFLQDDLNIVSGNLLRPNGIYWYDGYLWTACAGDATVYRVDDTTGETITYIAGVQNTHSLYIEEGENDPTIWIADFQRNAFAQVSSRSIDTLVEDLASPWGLAPAEDGTFYVTQLRDDNLINITRTGDIQTIAEGFNNPTGLAVDDAYIYVANNSSARRAIEWFEIPNTSSQPLSENDLQPLVSGLQNTTNVVLGPDGMLYFAYSLGSRGIVGRVDPQICREQEGCTNVDVEIVLWSELAAPLAGLVITPEMKLFVHTMFGAEIYWVQLPGITPGAQANATIQ